jgi:hypothetical protein
MKEFVGCIVLFIIVIVCSNLIPVEFYKNINCECDNDNKKYKDINFHDTIEDIETQSGKQMKNMDNSSVHLMNEDGLRYTSSNFHPVYSDSIFLSRVTNKTHAKKVENSGEMNSGFCHFHKHNPLKIEEKCRELSGDVCASTKCCVLLGGDVCVAGNQEGPYMKSNYKNGDTKNTDHYYRDGKCYGNCK